ncbi:MAG: hypothetical protein N2Z80_03385 [Hydrogenothermaceae bacterium]|nr:hypothetical protein [Hydrogenothermaceae bacterium]
MYVKVALPISVYQTFLYRVSGYTSKDSLVGKRVLVPFRDKKYYGFIVDIINEDQNKLNTGVIKDILYIDNFNTFTEKEIDIIKEISEYYLYPIGITVYYFIPNYLKGKNLDDEFVSKVFRLNQDVRLKLSKAQQRLVEFLSETGEATYFQILDAGFAKNTLRSLIRQGIVQENTFLERQIKLKQPAEGMQVELKASLKEGLYSLWGLSDRDRLFTHLELIKKYYREGSSVLIVFPSVTTLNSYYQTISNYIKDVKVYHDGISPKKQLDVWKEVQKGPSVILGTISSLLIPAKNLKLLIVEFEHSDSYKPISPKFDANRVAYLLSKYKSTTTIYSNRIPSLGSFLLLESRNIVKPKKYRKSVEVKRFEGYQKSLKFIESIIKRSESVLIIANRSYYASFVHCERCGFEWFCQKCNVLLRTTLEDERKALKCPKCHKTYPYSKSCPDCGHTGSLKEEGFGRDKVLKSLKDTMFYQVSLLEDESKIKVKVASSVDEKLLFGKFDTVINLYPDFLKNVESYTASEKFFRAVVSPYFIDSNRYVIISNMNDEIYKIFSNKDILSFYRQELEYRRKYEYPPIKNYLKLEVWSKHKVLTDIDIFLRNYYSEEEIYFRFISDSYAKYIIDSKDKEPLRAVFEKFTGKGKLSIEVNPKSI